MSIKLYYPYNKTTLFLANARVWLYCIATDVLPVLPRAAAPLLALCPLLTAQAPSPVTRFFEGGKKCSQTPSGR